MKNNVKIAYTYKNSNKGLIKIWTTLPMEHPDGTCTHSPQEKWIDEGKNEIFYFTLKENEVFQLNYCIDSYKQNEQIQLSDEEKTFYLRSGKLVVVDEEIHKLASEITADATTTMGKAKLLFYYVVNHYKYVYPPKGRGIKSFMKAKQGDCGEYSFLFSSLCRSIGIPCRTLIGSWSNGKMNAHVWNEFYDDQAGWVSVDCSMAYIQKKKKFQFFFGNIRTLKWKAYFGQLEGQRVVFSYDAELYLRPPFEELDEQTMTDANYLPIAPFHIDGQPFYWGYESIDGCAPYLQPIYVRFNQENLSVKPEIDTNKYLGHWTITETGMPRFLGLLKSSSYFAFFSFFLLSFFFNNPLLSVLSATAIILTCLSFIARKERMLFFIFIALYFSLYLGSSLMKFVQS